MRKFTLTHESLVKGVSADARRMTGLLCSMFVPLLSIMLKTDGTPFHINDLIHSYSKQFLEENNVQGLSILPIKVKGVITAFLLIQWCDEKELDSVNKQMASCHIRDARDSIEVQLGNQEKGYKYETNRRRLQLQTYDQEDCKVCWQNTKTKKHDRKVLLQYGKDNIRKNRQHITQ